MLGQHAGVEDGHDGGADQAAVQTVGRDEGSERARALIERILAEVHE